MFAQVGWLDCRTDLLSVYWKFNWYIWTAQEIMAKITLQHKDLTVEVFDDPLLNQTSNNSPLYDKIYQPDKDKDYRPVSQHAIIISRDNEKISSANLLGVAGATSATSDSVLI